jgi:hypothetical protein
MEFFQEVLLLRRGPSALIVKDKGFLGGHDPSTNRASLLDSFLTSRLLKVLKVTYPEDFGHLSVKKGAIPYNSSAKSLQRQKGSKLNRQSLGPKI